MNNWIAIMSLMGRQVVPIVVPSGDKYVPVGLTIDPRNGFCVGRQFKNKIKRRFGDAEMNVRGIPFKNRVAAIIFEPAAE